MLSSNLMILSMKVRSIRGCEVPVYAGGGNSTKWLCWLQQWLAVLRLVQRRSCWIPSPVVVEFGSVRQLPEDGVHLLASYFHGTLVHSAASLDKITT